MEKKEACLYEQGLPSSTLVNVSATGGDGGWIPALGRFPERGNGNPLQYSCLENPMDREAWWASPWGRKES